MEALKYFTPFSTSESAVRPFLRQDLQRGLAYMQRWSMDADEHVRRLASEGCRPRLPWSFQLTELMADPRPVLPILQNLRADGSLYVRKSVANHLNDISKDHAEWMLDQVATWDLGHVHTAWIVKRAARTLIKAGHPRSFVLLGFEREPRVAVGDLTLSATQIKLGEQLHFSFELRAEKETKQRLVVDYAVHFMKKSGRSTAKVFKLKEIELHPGQEVALVKVHKFQDYSTRKHYGGEHGVEIFINGHSVAQASFTLVC